MHSLTGLALPQTLGGLIGRTLRGHVWFIGAILLYACAG